MADDETGNADLATFVQNLLEQMQMRFQGMSENILTRIDEMGGRLDELEKSISDLVQQAGVEGSPAAAPAAGQNATQPAAPQPAKEG